MESMEVKKINITYQKLTEEYNNCINDPTHQNIDDLLCLIVKYILFKEFLFLLDISYPWEQIDKKLSILDSNLVIDYVPVSEGFLLQVNIPMQQILNNNIAASLEEITLSQRLAYINKIFPLIPCFD